MVCEKFKKRVEDGRLETTLFFCLLFSLVLPGGGEVLMLCFFASHSLVCTNILLFDIFAPPPPIGSDNRDRREYCNAGIRSFCRLHLAERFIGITLSGVCLYVRTCHTLVVVTHGYQIYHSRFMRL